MRFCFTMLAGLLLGLCLAPLSARATLVDWETVVGEGAPSGYVHANIVAPFFADIGTYDESSGITYEFIVNATNDGVSSALIGNSIATADSDRSAIKWEQWPDSQTLGTTDFGVADYDSGIANMPGVDTHLVFVIDGTNTSIYMNGAYAGMIAGSSPRLGGMVGIGTVYDGLTGYDTLTGTILGVAIYDEMLSADEIATHADAFFAVPEPSSMILAGLAIICGGWMIRRR